MSQNLEISASFNFQEHTILIIDDEPTSLKLLVSFLQGLGFIILTAQEGESGLEGARSGQPDLILLDILMPGIDGFEICRRLKDDETTKDIPVIFVTAAIDLQEKIKGFEVGAVDYITKPLHQAEVLARVTTHLRLRDLNRELHQELTRRKQAEQALQESEALFRATFEETSMGIGLTDMQGGILTANLAFQKMVGYSAAELREMTNLDLTHPDDINHSKILLQELVNGQRQSYQVEKRYRCKNDQVVWGRLTASLVRDDQERPLFVVGMIEDITDRKLAETALRESEERFRSYFELGLIGIVISSPLKGCLEVNDHVCQILGYERSQLLQMSWADFTHPDDLSADVAQFNRVLTGEIEGYSLEKRYIRKDGLVIHTTIAVKCVRCTDGSVDYFIALVQDITERKQVEEALAKERNLMRTLIDNLPDLIYVKDTDSRLLLVNNASLRNGTMTLEDLIGKTDFELHPPELAAQYYADDQAVLRSGQPIFDREEPNTGSGQLLWFSTTKVPLRNAQGQITGLVGMSRDITERKRAEQALRTSETRFRALATHAPVGIYETDAQGECVFVNQYWCDLNGLTFAEALGQGWTKSLHPDDRERIFTEWMAATQAGQEFPTLEYRIQKSGGKIGWVVDNAVILRNEAGAMVGYLGTITDITESKKMSEQLSQRAAQLMLINDISGKIAAVLELDSVLDRAAHLVHETFGYHHVALFLRDNAVVRLKAIAGSYTQYFPSNHTQELDRGIIGWVATHSEKLLANDVTQEPRYISKIADQTVTQAELCLPIRVAGQTVGVLDLQSPHLNAFGEHDIILMEILVAQLAVAIENARLYQSVQLELAERKQTEEALAQESNLLRTLIDNLPHNIYVKDTDSRFLIANQAMAHLVGKEKPDELIGKTDFEFFPHALVAKYYADEQAIMASGRPLISSEEPVIDYSTHESRWLLTTKVPLRDTHGKIVGIVGMGRDITERKQTEEALAQERNLLRTLIDHIPDYIYIKDHESQYLINNQAHTRMLGYERPEDLQGKTDFDVFPSELAAKYYADEQELIRSGQSLINHEEATIDSQEVERWVLTTKVPLRDNYGKIIGFVGVSRDITERKQIEVTLAEERNLLHTLIDTIPDLIYGKDTNSRFTRVNKAHARTIGYGNAAEAIGKTDFDFQPLELAQSFYAEEQEIIRTGQPIIDRLEFNPTHDQQPRWLSASKVPILNEAGQVIGLVGISRDVTHLKLMQDELRQAKEVAESADRAKSEFLANMSHEIRTPLNAIIGMTSLLLDTPLSSEQQDFTETVRTSGDSLLTIINDILDFSKIEAGKLELEKQPFDLRQCIEESLDLVAIKAAEKKLDLAYLIDDLAPAGLVGDVTRLRQILVNLLGNAIKFTEQGEIVLSVISHPLKNRSAENPASAEAAVYELNFAVRDTGLGIPHDRMDRLFQSFSQVDASTTRKYGGTGLGLTISKRLSEMMGGRMWVESEGIPGQGSTFHFTLLAEVDASQPQEFPPSKQPELIGKQILIVDDNATNRLILARQAQSWGMRARAAVSGEEALAWISRGDAFDLAILDMQMPDMDGLTLAKEIRRYRSPQTLPLIMLTSLGHRENNDLISQVKFAAYLTKPIKSSHLYNILLGVIAGQLVKVHPASTPLSMLDPKLGHNHPLHILLAEDNVVNQKVALQLLKRMGYMADIAANGLEVLQALKRQPYNVILMDMQMPEMDGLEATRCIHEQWPVEQRPWIIAMTANALQGDREHCLEAGMDDYVSKPVRPEELAQALLRYQPRSGQNEARTFTPTINPLPVEDKGGDHQIDQNGQVLEAKVLAELYDLLGDQAPQMIGELVDLYVGTAISLLEAMQTAIEKEDARALYQAAHTLKPSSAHLGAIHLSNLCKELEAIGHAGQLEGAAAKLVELEAEFDRVQAALEAEKRGNND